MLFKRTKTQKRCFADAERYNRVFSRNRAFSFCKRLGWRSGASAMNGIAARRRSMSAAEPWQSACPCGNGRAICACARITRSIFEVARGLLLRSEESGERNGGEEGRREEGSPRGGNARRRVISYLSIVFSILLRSGIRRSFSVRFSPLSGALFFVFSRCAPRPFWRRIFAHFCFLCILQKDKRAYMAE